MSERPTSHARYVIEAASDTLAVRRVFGEPHTQGDTTLIPVAKVFGGSGMGYGGGSGVGYGREVDAEEEPGPHAEGYGGGGGFGARVRPIGVYLLRDGHVTFKPAFDLNRAILGAQALGAVIALAIAWAHRGWFRWRTTQ